MPSLVSVFSISPNGNTVSYTYDPFDRTTAETYNDGTIAVIAEYMHDTLNCVDSTVKLIIIQRMSTRIFSGRRR